MSQTKYYAIKKGRNVGIYTDWKNVKMNVEGFKGAEYKSFKTYEEAYEYLNGKSLYEVESIKETLPSAPDEILSQIKFICLEIEKLRKMIRENYEHE